MRSFDKDHRYRILKREPNLHPSAHPRTCQYSSGPTRQFQPSWVVQYPWLHYSVFRDGAFCKACAFFAPEMVRGQVLGQFVTKPFTTWANKTQKMANQSSLEYQHVPKCENTWNSHLRLLVPNLAAKLKSSLRRIRQLLVLIQDYNVTRDARTCIPWAP